MLETIQEKGTLVQNMTDRELRQKAGEILEKLSLDEKIGMIHGAQLFKTAGAESAGIPPLVMSDGPMGVRQEFAPDAWKPVGNNDDYVTYLPCNSAIAATWNRELAYEMGSVLGAEARGRGKDVILAPGVNLKRSPLCGRNFEYFSEDPYLTKKLAAAYIRGVQAWDVAACVKHFAVNNQETQRLWVEVEIDEQVLRELYLPAFYEAVKEGGAYTVMGAYNRLYGEHCCQSDFLLRRILREKWGFDGVIISDWGGVHDTEAAAYSELDIEMSVTSDFDDYFMAEPLKKKILAGEIPESTVDKKVLYILMLMLRLHMIGDEPRKSGAYNTPEHRAKTLEAARESVVLLKNDDGRLPLSKAALKKVLLVGENAACVHSNGGGSAEIKALYEITPLMGLKTHLGGNAQVDYTPGYCRDGGAEQGDANWQETSLENGGGQMQAADAAAAQEMQQKRAALRKEAVRLAGQYDTVIYVGGLNHDYDCEGSDRRDMKLPYEQDRLIAELLEVKPDMVIVMIGGSPVEMGQWIDKAKTLVWHWYAGMEGGNALAEVLLGETNPSGKLPETFYKTHTDCSAHSLGEFPGTDKVAYREGRYVGYRYNDKYRIEPQFPFGYGLSYTTFAYRDAVINPKTGVLSCFVKNTGDVAGKETVQVYRRDTADDAPVMQELAGFEKVFLEPGEEKQVEIAVELYGMQYPEKAAEPSGEKCGAVSAQTSREKAYVYCVGSSSRDIRLTCCI
ncbi:glycoside hydrolase family 3 C-terminal domain-containing protein [Marvinbryantia formatexigens]|nr:glycoside hydrolase family 3 C-terminal domain-containing protein [Marvinbryantia formatexigens]UWO25859.1 glycoside hydrolase family 3 C-terminal domain-containing protein [Marvinbryantia formatexigens DSM 14469]SDF40439.1 beta-glucosidase [Marvinbryantia formatexigens]